MRQEQAIASLGEWLWDKSTDLLHLLSDYEKRAGNCFTCWMTMRQEQGIASLAEWLWASWEGSATLHPWTLRIMLICFKVLLLLVIPAANVEMKYSACMLTETYCTCDKTLWAYYVPQCSTTWCWLLDQESLIPFSCHESVRFHIIFSYLMSQNTL